MTLHHVDDFVIGRFRTFEDWWEFVPETSKEKA